MLRTRFPWIALAVAATAFFVTFGLWWSTPNAQAQRPIGIAEAKAVSMPRITVDPAVLKGGAPASPTSPTNATAGQPPATQQAAYVIKRVLDIPSPMRPGDWHWDDAGVPDGPVVITVDLKAQTMSVFRGGYEIGAAVVLYGADDKPTPLGVYPISQKKVRHISNLYDASMPYMQRLTNDGVAIHASELGPNLATHGCIGVPLAFAKKLFAATKLGDKVIVTNGEMLNTGGVISAI